MNHGVPFGSGVPLAVAVTLCLCALLGTEKLSAQPSPAVRIVLLTGGEGAWTAAETAFLEELALLPFSVEPIKVAQGEEGGDESDRLREASVRFDARVAVSILRGATEPDRVSVRLYEADLETDVIKSWRIDPSANPDAAFIVGIRAAEAVRAALREGASPPNETTETGAAEEVSKAPAAPSKSDERDVVPVVSQRTPPQPTRIGVGGGISGGTSFENAGGYGGILLALDWRPFRFAGLALDALYLPWGPDVSGGGVTSRLDLVLFRAQVETRFRKGKRVRPGVGVGGGGLLVIAEGIRSDGRRLTKDLTKVGYLGGSISVSVKVTGWMRLQAVAGLGASLPAVTLRHGEVVAARLGRPLFDLSIRAMFGTN